MQNLSAGGNTALGADTVDVSIDWSPAQINGCDVDASAFLLTSTGKVRGDQDFIFYNQPNADANSVSLTVSGSKHTFRVNTKSLPAGIEKVAFAVTIHGNASFSDASQLQVSVSQTANFQPNISSMKERALIVGEVYNRKGQWKFRAVGQGFNGGLGPLATSFGVDVGDDEAAAPEPQPTPPPPPEPKVSLSKITLKKKGDSHTISLKKGDRNKEIVINLNWSAKPENSGGFFGSLFGGNSEIDLDLGVFWELRNGYKSVIDGMQFSKGRGGPRDQISRQGCYSNMPWVWHCGDDRSGSSSAGENILVNPNGFSDLKRLVVYCFIYEGAAKWDQTNAVVTVKVPGNPDIVVEMGQQKSSSKFCAIAGLEFSGSDQVKVTKYVTFHQDHSYCDREYSWGMRWGAGSKD